MAINTGDISLDQTQEVTNESLGLVSRAVEAVRTHSRTALLALGIGTYAVAASAEDVRVADASGSVQLAALQNDSAPTAGESVETGSEWLNNLDLGNPMIREFIAPRITDANFEYMRPYLVAFSELSHDMQDYLARADAGIGGTLDDSGEVVDALDEDMFTLLRNLRVPPQLVEDIVAEFTSNPGSAGIAFLFSESHLRDNLSSLAESGDIDSTILNTYILAYAPNAGNGLPIVQQSHIAQGELADAQGELADAQGELADSQGELAEATAARDAMRAAIEAAGL